MNYNAIATELSYLVLQKQQAEREGRDVPKVTAPAEQPARFDAYPVQPVVGFLEGPAQRKGAR